jgi:hypothetical protein
LLEDAGPYLNHPYFDHEQQMFVKPDEDDSLSHDALTEEIHSSILFVVSFCHIRLA